MCINGASLERDKFATYFWEVYNKLDSSKVSLISESPSSVSFCTIIPYLHIPFLFHYQVACLYSYLWPATERGFSPRLWTELEYGSASGRMAL